MKSINLKFFTRITLIVFLFSLVLFSCTKDSISPTSEMGEMKIYLVDSPAEYDAVNIVVNRVEVHKSDIGGSDSGWVVINDQSATYNLLELRNGVTASIRRCKTLCRSLYPNASCY